MSQIARLHSTEIANGNLIDATHLNNEYDQLVSESNSQDTRLTTAESKITNLTNSFKSMISGLVVQYNTSNRVVIKPGVCRDARNTDLMEVTTDITVDLSVNGANGLDTGTEAASTWYYLYLIKNPSSGAVAGLFSTVNESNTGAITMPSGYTLKRQLPIAVRNDASANIIPFIVGEGWPHRPMILYDVALTNWDGSNWVAGTTNTLSAGTSASYASVSAASYIPPIAQMGYFNAVNSSAAHFNIRSAGESHNGKSFGNGGGTHSGHTIIMKTNSSQEIEYKRTSGTGSLYLDVQAYIVTEVR